MPLFNRRAVLQIEGRDLSDLRLSFDVSKDLKGRPNKASITVYNLAEETRRQISQVKEKRVVLLAGYATETPHAVFVGTLKRVSHSNSGADWVTKVSSEDGVPRSSRVSVSLGRGASVDRALTEVARQMGASGVGAGNSTRVAQALRNRSTGASGLALSGAADVVLDQLLAELGLEWSVQDQQLQILERGKPRQTRVVLLSPETGLVGSPEILERGRAKAKALLVPGLDPGLLVEVQSRDVAGFFRIDSARYTGDTWGQPWYADVELRPVS